MTKSCSRRIVVLRDIPSNIIEEAILVLKNESPQNEKSAAEKNELEKKKDFLVIKEAETIINSYISKDNAQFRKPGLLKGSSRKWYIDLVINTVLLVGITLFIYLVCKAL